MNIFLELEQNVIDDLQSVGKSVVNSRTPHEFSENSLSFFSSLKGFEEKYKEGLVKKGLPQKEFSMPESFLGLWTSIISAVEKWKSKIPEEISNKWDEVIQKHEHPEKVMSDLSNKLKKSGEDKLKARMIGMIMANLFQKQYEGIAGKVKGFEAPSKEEAEELLKNRNFLSEVMSGILKVLFNEDKERAMESIDDMKKRVREGLLKEGIDYETENSIRVKAELVEHYLTDPDFLEMDKHSRINLIHSHLAGEVSSGNLSLQEANDIKKEYLEAENGIEYEDDPEIETELDSEEATEVELDFIKKKIFSLVDQEIENPQEAEELKSEISSYVNGFRSGNLEFMKNYAFKNPENSPKSFENLAWDEMDKGNMEWYFIYKGIGELFKPLEFAEWVTELKEGKRKKRKKGRRRIGYGFPYWWGQDHEGDADLGSGIGDGGGGE